MTDSIGTIIVSLILIASVIAITIKLIRDKKKGGTVCNCAHCTMANACHKNAALENSRKA